MKDNEVRVGQVYRSKVTDKVVDVKIDGKNPEGGWDATNLATGKAIRIKSADRLQVKATKRKVGKPPKKASAEGSGGRVKGKMSGLAAAVKILGDAGGPMTTGQITEAAITKGLWAPEGKTPAATLYSAILREIGTKGKDSRFKKVARGQFELTA